MDEIQSPGRITFGGLATGLDTGAIVDAVMGAERLPLLAMENRLANAEARKSALQTFNSNLLALRNAARSIDNRTLGLNSATFNEELFSFLATPSDDSVLEAEASSDAVLGSFEIRVLALAAPAQRVSVAYADGDTSIASDTRSFSIAYAGGSIDLSVAAGTTLSQLRDAINADAGNDGTLEADLLFDGTGTRLVVSGTETGVANDITITTNILGPASEAFVDTSEGVGQAASDARLEYLGVSITRDSNEITDLVPGVTLRLRGINDVTDESDVVSIDVARNDEAIEAALQEFVDAFNAIRDFSLAQTTLDPETNRGGVLIGDPQVRSIERRLQNVIQARYDFGEAPADVAFPYLSSIGITFDSTGSLQIDGEQLREALDEDRNAVRRLLGGEGTGEPPGTLDGVASALARMLEPVLDTDINGNKSTILLRQNGIDDQIKRIEVQIERFEARMVSREETLLRRFSILEGLISSLQAQSGFFGPLDG